jgi:fatty acid desaturase
MILQRLSARESVPAALRRVETAILAVEVTAALVIEALLVWAFIHQYRTLWAALGLWGRVVLAVVSVTVILVGVGLAVLRLLPEADSDG